MRVSPKKKTFELKRIGENTSAVTPNITSMGKKAYRNLPKRGDDGEDVIWLLMTNQLSFIDKPASTEEEYLNRNDYKTNDG